MSPALLHGGDRHVAAYLTGLDISAFDPKAPPPKTAAFRSIVDASRAVEDAELADLFDRMGNPDAVTLDKLHYEAGGSELGVWLKDRGNRRAIPHRLETVPVRNDAADGLWKIAGKRQVIYAKAVLSLAGRLRAARAL